MSYFKVHRVQQLNVSRAANAPAECVNNDLRSAEVDDADEARIQCDHLVLGDVGGDVNRQALNLQVTQYQSATVDTNPTLHQIGSLYEKPELSLAVTLVGLFGLRPAELKAMRVENGKLKVGNVKRNRATAKAPKPDRIAYPLEISGLAGAAGQALAQLSSGLVKLPVGILNAQDFKTCGHTFRQYLDRHPYWAALVKASPGLSPYSLRHGYAYREALAGIPLRQLAASMGHDVRTHMKHYSQWTDEAGLGAAFGAANAKITASLTKRQQQMQQQQ